MFGGFDRDPATIEWTKSMRHDRASPAGLPGRRRRGHGEPGPRTALSWRRSRLPRLPKGPAPAAAAQLRRLARRLPRALAWDKVVRSSHWVNCWYQAHCAWNVYVKDGMVWREEQVADYPQIRPDVPDFNPRGCQKGACFSERMYDPARVRYPLKRAGERGSGKWKRISWEQALE